MPDIARARKGETIDELTERLFRAADPKTGMKAATERLLEANQHLRLKGRGRARAVVEEAIVVVPEVEGAKHDRRSTTPLGNAAARALLKRTQEALEALQPAMERARAEALAELSETLRLADSEPLRSAADNSPELAARLVTVRDWTERRLADVDAGHVARTVAVERAASTIVELLERASSDDGK